MISTDARERFRRFLPVFALVSVSALAFLRYRSISHYRTFHFDEWYWVLLRNDFSQASLLENHNGHLSIIPGFIYVTLFRTVGLSHYSIYLSLAFVTHIAVSCLLFHLFRKKFGAAVGLLIASLALFLGSGAQNYLWAFQIGFMFSILGYLIGRTSFVSDVRYRPYVLLAALSLSLGSSGMGVPVAAALGLEALLRRLRIRDFWPFLVTGSLYLVWYVNYGRSDANGDFAHLIPKYARDSAAAVVAGVFDFTLDWGYLALGVLCGLFIATIIGHRKLAPATAGAVLFLLLFWSLTCLSRAQYWDVGAGRYIYAAFVPFLMILLDVVPKERRTVTTLTAGILVPLAISASWSRMDNEANFYKLWGQSVGAELLALELHRDVAPWDYFPDKVRAPNIYAQSYFAATDALGSSPASTLQQLPLLMREARLDFDRVSLELGDITATPTSPSSTICDGTITSPTRMRLRLQAGHQYFTAVENDVVVGFKRFGNSRSETAQISIKKGSTVQVTVRPDGIQRPWVAVQVSPDGRLCRSLNGS